MNQIHNSIIINRTTAFDQTNAGMSTPLELVSEDSQSIALASIDLSRVQIVSILDITEEHPTAVNQKIEEHIAQLKEQGYVFLDAKILETLLAHPEQVPQSWITYADTDALDTAGIEFRGTIFRNSGEDSVLNLSFARGSWYCGHGGALYTEQEIASFAQIGPWGRLVRYAAVLLPEDKTTILK